MTTPEQARKIADWWESRTPYDGLMETNAIDLIRDLARQVEELQAQVAELQTEIQQANSSYMELLRSAESGYF